MVTMGAYTACISFIYLQCFCLLLCDAQYTKKAISAKLNPCHSRDCGTGKECRIQERSCSRLPCPLATTCVDVKLSTVRCSVGKPILDHQGEEKLCRTSRDCSSNAYCVAGRDSERGSLNRSSGCCWRGLSFRETHVRTVASIRSLLNKLILRDYAIERASFNFSRYQFGTDFRASHSNYSSVHQPEHHANHTSSSNFYAGINSGPIVNADTANNISFHTNRGRLVNTDITESQHSNITNLDVVNNTNFQAEVHNDVTSRPGLTGDHLALNPFGRTVQPAGKAETTPRVAITTNPLSHDSPVLVSSLFRIEPHTDQEPSMPERTLNQTKFETPYTTKHGALSYEGLDAATTATSKPLNYASTATKTSIDNSSYPVQTNAYGSTEATNRHVKEINVLLNITTDTHTDVNESNEPSSTNPFSTSAPTNPSNILGLSFPLYLQDRNKTFNAPYPIKLSEVSNTTSYSGVTNSYFHNTTEISNPFLTHPTNTPQGREKPSKPISHSLAITENIAFNSTNTGNRVTLPTVYDNTNTNDGENQHVKIVTDTVTNKGSQANNQSIDSHPQTTTNGSNLPDGPPQDTSLHETNQTFNNSFPETTLHAFTSEASVSSTLVNEPSDTYINISLTGTGEPTSFPISDFAANSHITTPANPRTPFPISADDTTIIGHSATLATTTNVNSSIVTIAAPGLTSMLLVTSSNNNTDNATFIVNPSLTINSSFNKSSSLGNPSRDLQTDHMSQSNSGHQEFGIRHSTTNLHSHRKRRNGSGYYRNENYGVNSEGLQQTFPEPGAYGVFGTNEHEPAVEVPLEKPGQCSRMVMGKWSARCMDTCFNDADCPFSQKCCNNGCARSCQMVASILNLRSATSKPGGCPKPGLFGEVSRCFGKSCNTDTECPGRSKCCISLGCGMICKSPNSESVIT